MWNILTVKVYYEILYNVCIFNNLYLNLVALRITVLYILWWITASRPGLQNSVLNISKGVFCVSLLSSYTASNFCDPDLVEVNGIYNNHYKLCTGDYQMLKNIAYARSQSMIGLQGLIRLQSTNPWFYYHISFIFFLHLYIYK